MIDLFFQAPIQVFGLEGRYAHALYSAAAKEKKLEVVEKDIKAVQVLCVDWNIVNIFFTKYQASDLSGLHVCSYSLSHNYLSQSFYIINKKNIHHRKFPFQQIITEFSGNMREKFSEVSSPVCQI